MLICFQVAEYLLTKFNPEEGDLVSNLKLQKLVYYAEGLHLALHDESLFPEPIEAWTHGPVVPELYRTYKDCGSNAIPFPECIDFFVFDAKSRQVMDEVYNVFGQFSAWKLALMVYNERPWMETPRGQVISRQLMKEYFKSQLIDDEEESVAA